MDFGNNPLLVERREKKLISRKVHRLEIVVFSSSS
jgi:hypothetical protein